MTKKLHKNIIKANAPSKISKIYFKNYKKPLNLISQDMIAFSTLIVYI